MILAPVRTKHLQIDLKEMSIGNAVDICSFPPELHEAGTTLALNAICKTEIDCRALTVQERALIIAMYHSQLNSLGINFKIGQYQLFDYLTYETYEKDEFSIGSYYGDEWFISPLIGYESESIERLVSQGRLRNTRLSWWLGAMAAMLVRKNKVIGKELKPDYSKMNDTEIDDHIYNRAIAFNEFEETAFVNMLSIFLDSVSRLNHLFKLSFQDYGICWSAIEEEKGIPPTRFRFESTVSPATYRIFGKSDEPDS